MPNNNSEELVSVWNNFMAVRAIKRLAIDQKFSRRILTSQSIFLILKGMSGKERNSCLIPKTYKATHYFGHLVRPEILLIAYDQF